MKSLKKEKLCFDRIHTYPLAVTAKSLVSDYTVNFSIQSIITSESYVGTGVNPGSQLPDQDVSSPDNLAAVPFYTTPLALAVPAIP